MQRKERALGTNRDMAHHVGRADGGRRREPSDEQLLRQARAATRQWQARLEKDRRREQQR